MNNSTSGGYAGLIALLITFLLMALLIWRMDLFSGSSNAIDSSNATEISPLYNTSPIQQNLNVIKAAEDAKQKLESQYNQQMKEIGN